MTGRNATIRRHRLALKVATGDVIRFPVPNSFPEQYVVGQVKSIYSPMPGLLRVLVRHEWWNVREDQSIEVL